MKDIKLSEHFKLSEMTKTSYVTADGNQPPLEAVENLVNICNWLEELRFQYNMLYVLPLQEDYETSELVEGIVINQGFRSYQVMLAMEKAGLHPSHTSNHMTGCAVDIRCMGQEHAIRMMTILLDIADVRKEDFDELFFERRATVYWLHFAVRPQDNRRKIRFMLG